jgi:zinc transport system ATP-binding protein
MWILCGYGAPKKMNTNTDNIITVHNASFGYNGQAVISDLTVSVRRGDYFCIIGENGSGKTTLLKGMLGLISPIRGTVRLDGQIKRTEIGYLDQQDPDKKDFPAGVEEVVQSGVLASVGLRPFYSRREKQRVRENMRLLEITGLKDRCYRELSGGQRRRVLLARALCAAKKLLVLDEPMAGLDPLISAEIYKLLKNINRETGITIIMVSQNIEAAKKYASEILNLGKSLLD